MTHVWFAIAHFLQTSFNVVLVSAGWATPITISLTLAFGAAYWLIWQGKASRRAKEGNELI